MHRVLAIAAVVAGCGNDPVHHLPDAPCLQALTDYVAAYTTPSTYLCHEPYKLKIDLTNNSCAGVRVQDIKITGVVTSGPCVGPGPGSLPAFTAPAGATSTIADFTSQPFCCLPGACPTPFQCDEEYTITIDTPQGAITKKTTAHLSLDGCDSVCPTDAGP